MNAANTTVLLTPELKERAQKIMAHYEESRSALLPILHLIQNTYGFISEQAEREVAEWMGISLVDMREVTTFYTLYRSKPCAKIEFNICRTLSCVLRGSEEIMHHLEEKLGIASGQQTKDGKFGWKPVECLGACELAPIAEINGQYVGLLTKEKIDEFMKGRKQ